MILCDTGVIVAAIAKAEKNHVQAFDLVRSLSPPLNTTWPCLTEAMYLLGQVGPNAQETLRRQIESRLYALPAISSDDIYRACALMRQYADTPMDFADASLVVAAEKLNITRILTFDRHFYAYRIHGRTPFEVLPG